MGAGLHGLNGLSPKVSCKLINTFVEPRYLYGLEIMGLSVADKNSLLVYQKKTLKQIQHLPDRTSNAAVFLLLGAMPIIARIEINQLILFRMISANDTCIEYKIAERQLAMKSDKSKSWFVETKKLLKKYNLPSAYDLLTNVPNKHAWKDAVNSAVCDYWNDQLKSDAIQKPSLKYFNTDHCQIGKTHQVWDTVEYNKHDISRATVKAKLLTGTYTLQANKARFNQNKVDPTCLLCNESAETREHFVTTCTKLKKTRDQFLLLLKEKADVMYPNSWSYLSSTPQLLTHFILDSTYFATYPNLHAPCEPITRMLLYRLHTIRSAFILELASK
jgi:hypothetical protein